MASDQPQSRVSQLPRVHPLLQAAIAGVIGGLVEFVLSFGAFEPTALFTVAGVGISMGVAIAAVVLAIWIGWEEWYYV